MCRGEEPLEARGIDQFRVGDERVAGVTLLDQPVTECCP